MAQIEKTYGGRWINTDRVIKGKFSEVKKALEYCGIEYNMEAVKRGIIK